MKKLNILTTITVSAVIAWMSATTTSCTKTEYIDRFHTDTVTNTDTVHDTDTVLAGPGIINLNFDNMVGSADFDLISTFTLSGVPYRFEHVRYWVSNVSLVKEDGSLLAIPRSYYLMEECGDIAVQDGDYTYPANKRELVQLKAIPEGRYKGIVFHVGVDEIYNTNLSLQAGELSQLSGMTNISWMWHTSYIFSAVKGEQNASDFNVEVGTNDAYRRVELDFASHMTVRPTGENNVHIKVDIAKVFGGIDLNATPAIGAGTAAAMMQVADNYKNEVFSVIAAE